MLRDLSLTHQGLIQMTGPTGSGKSTTAHEVLVATPAGAQPDQGGQDPPAAQLAVTGSRDGMVTLEQSLSSLIHQGIVTEEDALAAQPLSQDVETRPRMTAALDV